MRIIFAGTPVFAKQALTSIIQAGHDVVLVLSQPDRPAGRGKKLRASPVKQAAIEAEIPVFQPVRLKGDESAWQTIRDVNADVMVVAAYGLILPEAVLQIPPHGCINIHASLLPRWRGAAPIQRAIQAGDNTTGITIMQMDEGLDTGDMLLTVDTPITDADTGETLHDRLARLGSQAIVDALLALERGELTRKKQPEDGATYAHRLTGEDAQLDWSLNRVALMNRIRAFDPVPGNSCRLASAADAPIKIWQVQAQEGSLAGDALPGQVLYADDKQVQVACGDSIVSIEQIQRAGGRRMAIGDFQRGAAIKTGDRFVTV